MSFASNSPRAAIIVPFAAFDDLVAACVRRCLALDYENFVLVLLPDQAIARLEDPRILTVITGDVTIGAKRNLGIAAAPDVDFYLFLDSDAYPASDWLSRVVLGFAEQPAVAALGGPNISPPVQPDAAKPVGFAAHSFLLSGSGRFRKRISASRFCLDLPTCNLAVRADAIAAVGGFDPTLTTGEDQDLCYKLVMRFGPLYFLERAIVFHHDRSLFLPFLRQRFCYGCSTWKILFRDFGGKFYMLAPFFLLMLLLGSGAGALYSPWLLLVFLSSWISLLLACAVEAVRWAPATYRSPTFFALLLGVLAPGVGTLAMLLPIPIDVRSYYKR